MNKKTIREKVREKSYYTNIPPLLKSPAAKPSQADILSHQLSFFSLLAQPCGKTSTNLDCLGSYGGVLNTQQILHLVFDSTAL